MAEETMEEHILPLLHISSEYKGLVKINESVAGETGSAAITTPVTPNGLFYLTFLPLENPGNRMLLPFTRKLSIGKNMQLSCADDFMTVCIWPDNIYQIEIDPPGYSMSDPAEVSYREFASFEFIMGQKQYTASVVRDYQCYLMVEDSVKKRNVYAYPLEFEVQSARITLNWLHEAPYLLVEGVSDEGAFVAVVGAAARDAGRIFGSLRQLRDGAG